jgi:hypothetical protein
MFHQDDFKRPEVGQSWGVTASGHKAHWLTLAERGFRYADELDYSVRRWVIPDHPSQASRSPATNPMRSDGVLSDLQLAIGRCLQAEYDVAQPIPDRLAALVRDIERAG